MVTGIECQEQKSESDSNQIQWHNEVTEATAQASNEVPKFFTYIRDPDNFWFCCQLNRAEDRCTKEMKGYPRGIYVPKGMKCWYKEFPPLSYTVFLDGFGRNARF